MGDRVAVLKNGRLSQVASPEDLYRFPVDAEVARFVGEAVLVGGEADDEQVECCFGHLPLALQTAPEVSRRQAVEVMIRPEQFHILTSGPLDPALPHARVEQMQFYGHDARLGLRLECGQSFTATILGHSLPQLGQVVNFEGKGKVIAFPPSGQPGTLLCNGEQCCDSHAG